MQQKRQPYIACKTEKLLSLRPQSPVQVPVPGHEPRQRHLEAGLPGRL